MFNKKSIFILIVSMVMFFGWQDVIKAETKTCTYSIYAVDGQVITGNTKMTFQAINDNNKYRYTIDNGDITLYKEGSNKEFQALQCPTYLVNLKADTRTVYTANTSDPAANAKTLKNIYYAYKLVEEQNAQSGGNYVCYYNVYTVGSTTPKATDMKVTFYYDQDVNGVDTALNNVWLKFGKYDTTNYFEYGNESGQNRSRLSVNTCPEFLVPTHNIVWLKYKRYIDGFDIGSETQVYEKANTTYGYMLSTKEDFTDNTAGNNGIYFQKSEKQREEDAKNKPVLGACSYYRDDHKLLVTVKRYTSPTVSYDVDITYINGIGNKDGLKLISNPNNIDKKILDTIVNNSNQTEDTVRKNEPCIDYQYLEVGDLGIASDGDSVTVNFIEKITDIKKAFKYFKIATTKEAAEEYKTKLRYAYDVLFGPNESLISIVSDSNNIETMNRKVREKFLEYARNGGPDDIANVASYLESGGKASKAIYDYSNYWYAMAMNYASLYVADEDCSDNTCNDASQYNADSSGQNGADKYNDCLENSDCLKFMALQFAQKIEENVKDGYIPIPDGCDMLSQDLLDFLTWALQIIRYGAVIITIALGMVDFFRAIAESDDKAFQKAGGRFMKRLVAVVLIFLSALFVQFILYNYALPGIGEEEVTLCNISKSN